MKTLPSVLPIVLLLTVVLIACAAPPPAAPETAVSAAAVQNTIPAPSATIAPLPLAAPTIAAPAPASATIYVTTTTDDKCKFEVHQPVSFGKHVVHWDVKSKQHDAFLLVVSTLDPGKTIGDLRTAMRAAEKSGDLSRPDFFHLAGPDTELPPGGSTEFFIEVDQNPLYFTCFYRDPITWMGSYGPVAVGTIPANEITVRASAGNQCTLEGPKAVAAGRNTIHWMVDGFEHEAYLMIPVTLDAGKTIQDLRGLDPANMTQPPWVHYIASDYEQLPGSSLDIPIQFEAGKPVYFVCFYRDPETLFASLGPVEVK